VRTPANNTSRVGVFDRACVGIYGGSRVVQRVFCGLCGGDGGEGIGGDQAEGDGWGWSEVNKFYYSNSFFATISNEMIESTSPT